MLERFSSDSQDSRRIARHLIIMLVVAGAVAATAAEPANPALGLREARGGTTALVGATVWVTPDRKLEEATLLVVDGRVAAVGTDVTVPEGASVVDLAGRVVYPGFVEPWSEYGLAHVGDLNAKKESREIQYGRAAKGTGSWNDAVHAERTRRHLYGVDEVDLHLPVEVADYPGFVSNRILMPMINEAAYCLMEGVATRESIDTVMKLGMNHPMGPLALADLIGLDTCLSIMEVLHQGFGDSKYRPCPLLRKMVAAGWLGRKTGRGFYEYPAA